MNYRLLNHDASILPASLLERIKQRRVHARTVKPDGVRITTRSGNQYLLSLLAGSEPVGDGLSVYVWWAPAGLVCAPVADVDAAEATQVNVVDQVKRARDDLARARAARPTQPEVRAKREALTDPGELTDADPMMPLIGAASRLAGRRSMDLML